MVNKKYNELIDNIVDYVGGVSNISYFTHCATRLRFNLKDRGLVDFKAIEETPSVVGVQWSGEQLQLIIGTSVAEVYQEINNKYQIGENDSAPKSGGESNRSIKGFLNNVLAFIGGSVQEALPVLIGAGMINVILVLLTTFNLIDTASTTYQIFSFVSDSGFYFLPVYVGYSSSKRIGMNPMIGAFFGAMMLHPNFTALVDGGKPISLLGLPVYATAYSSTFVPVMLTVLFASYIYKFMQKVSPEILKSMLVPMVTILISAPVAFVVLAPLGSYIGSYIAGALVWLYDTTGFIGLAVIGALYPILTITGMQHTFGPYLFQALAANGFEAICFPVTYISNINCGVAALAVSIKTKSVSIKSTAYSTSITAILSGITEPSLFGVLVKYKTPLIATIIGNAIGCAAAAIMHVVGYTFVGSFGVLGFAAFIGDAPNNLMFALISWAIGIVITFIATLILYKDPVDE